MYFVSRQDVILIDLVFQILPSNLAKKWLTNLECVAVSIDDSKQWWLDFYLSLSQFYFKLYLYVSISFSLSLSLSLSHTHTHTHTPSPFFLLSPLSLSLFTAFANSSARIQKEQTWSKMDVFYLALRKNLCRNFLKTVQMWSVVFDFVLMNDSREHIDI